MHRSSESVAALTAALAKAQTALVNPEKSLTATIRSDRAGERERTFRYAPLSAGLDIVRKTLGQHEIAVVQTTATDPSTGIVNLTTVLAHASGEWIASEWPVCPTADTATPHRMGAALTYARRYALFTLVGIAGEDDLDAPDLHAETSNLRAPGVANGNGDANRETIGTNPPQVSRPHGGRHDKFANGRAVPLNAAQSAELRSKLLAQVADITSADMATTLALRILPEKNKLTAADAMLVEQAFEQKLTAFPSRDDGGPAHDGAVADLGPITQTQDLISAPTTRRPRQRPIDKSSLPFGEPRRYRNREHLRFVARQSCLICARTPSDPHHIPFAQPRALGRKVSDEFTVPLCRGHHREVHRSGDEAAWWAKVGIEPLKAARKLWRQTRQTSAELQGGRHAETALQWRISDPAADPKHHLSEVSILAPTSVDAP